MKTSRLRSELYRSARDLGNVQAAAKGLAIRSEVSVGKCIELSLDEAQDLADRLTSTMTGEKRRIRDEPQA
jgi:hypothetical protein